jgi:leucyl-tRNA synthetase
LNSSSTSTIIKPEDLSDEVFSFIFLKKEFPAGFKCNISTEVLLKMREEFEYWYPFDIRVSAKDLIQNHLTMCLYHHTEIWKDNPKFWPGGIYCNGHIMVDAEKMSKSKGNFLMLLESVEEYTADATRFALADGGDSMEDANFDRSVANQAIINLYIEEEWIKSTLIEMKEGKLRKSTSDNEQIYFMDKAFNNEIDYLIETTFIDFNKICFKDGLKRCWFQMTIARDIYRDWSVKCSIPVSEKVILRFIEALVIMMSPITPHWSEHIWSTIIGKTNSIVNESWPVNKSYDRDLRKQYNFFNEFMKNTRQAILKFKPTGNNKNMQVYISPKFESNKIIVLKYMETLITESKFSFEDKDDKEKITGNLRKFIETHSTLNTTPKLVNDMMQFAAFMRDETKERGIDALATEMTFDQKAILEVMCV